MITHGGVGGQGVQGQVFCRDPASYLLLRSTGSDILSSSVEQLRTGETNLLKRTSDLTLFILYQISASCSLGRTGGDTVNCYSFHFLFSPSLNINISLHSYTPLYLELIFNYLLNQTGNVGCSTWSPWDWLGTWT